MSRSILVVLAISEGDHYYNHVDFFEFYYLWCESFLLDLHHMCSSSDGFMVTMDASTGMYDERNSPHMKIVSKLNFLYHKFPQQVSQFLRRVILYS